MLIGGSTESNRSYFGDIQRALSFFSLTVVTSADASEPNPSTVPVSRPTGVVPGAVLAVPPVRDTSTARDILARTLWGEARGEGREGITGVASVVVNRASRGANYWWGGTIEDVCRKPWQFSCWNQHDPNRRKLLQVTSGDAAFNICLEVADAAVNGRLQDVTFGSTHYHDFSVHPTWAHNRSPCIRVGKLIFYNNVEPLR